MKTALDSCGAGMLIINASGMPCHANSAARNLLGLGSPIALTLL